MKKMIRYTLPLFLYWVVAWLISMAFFAEWVTPINFVFNWTEYQEVGRFGFMSFHGMLVGIIYTFLITTREE